MRLDQLQDGRQTRWVYGMYNNSTSDCIGQLNALQYQLRDAQVSLCNVLDLNAISEPLQQIIIAVEALEFGMERNTLEQL
jgi:hypothetical protein